MALEGIFDDVRDINKQVAQLTGDAEPSFDEDTEEWRNWVDYRNGTTVILTDAAEQPTAIMCI